MIYEIPSAEAQLEFLRKLRRLLDEGGFVASYKFALLHAIADLCVTNGDDMGAPLPLGLEELAGEYIRLYWRQTTPFPGLAVLETLAQNTSGQAAVLNWIREVQPDYAGRLGRFERSSDWDRLVRKVARKINEMPLWRLQTIGTEPDEFLYANHLDQRVDEIELKPGVAYCFRAFYPMIAEMVQVAWTQYVRGTNLDRLGPQAELRDFLFGTEREDLSSYRRILRDVQSGACFYCGRALGQGDEAVDHFVPWRRYPLDLGHNFVLADRTCNAAKADRLAATSHLERWHERNLEELYELPRRFDDERLPHDREASLRIARWAYQLEASTQGKVWVKGKELVRLPEDWEAVLNRRHN